MTGPVANTISQGILAKLLATENITVHVGNYTTAFFDVKNRVLGLPSWNVDSKAVSDLLIGHEVGHALWTPEDGIDQFRAAFPHIPFSILNIVEDIRIERMIQDRFPGLISAFNSGYEHFLKSDFFRINALDVNKLGFADRLNIKAKLRHLIDVKFTAAEQAIFDRSLKAETFDDVVNIVCDVYEMVKGEPQPKTNPAGEPKKPDKNAPKEPGEPAPKREPSLAESLDKKDIPDDDEEEEDEMRSKKEESDTSDNTEPGDNKDGADSKSDKESDDKEQAETGSTEGDAPSDDEAEKPGEGEKPGNGEKPDDTPSGEKDLDPDDKLEESDSVTGKGGTNSNKKVEEGKKYKSPEEELSSSTLDSLNDELSRLQTNFGSTAPVMAPSEQHLKASVTPWQRVVANRRSTHEYQSSFINRPDLHADWITYKRSVKKNIQNLISDFERKKAAYQYTRAQVSDAGDIDVNRLHAYKFDDQIFRSITKLADAKNHGMMFFIDYSGSMMYDIFNVLDHTLNLVMFCNAVGIPYQVFGFTNHASGAGASREEKEELAAMFKATTLNNQISLQNVNVFELLSSKMKPKELDLAMREIRGQIFHCKNNGGYWYGIPYASKWEAMVGTPLVETVLVAHYLVKEFRKDNHVQKMNVIFLSDGDGAGLKFGTNHDNANKQKDVLYGSKIYLLNLMGKEVSLSKFDPNFNYAALVQHLKATLNCTTVGFFISRKRKDLRLSGINAHRYSKQYGLVDHTPASWGTASALAEKKDKSFRKNRCSFIPGGFNFDCYFLVDSREATIHDDENFDSNIDDEEFQGKISGSTQNKLAREFTKFTSEKKSSRIILNQFAEIIA